MNIFVLDENIEKCAAGHCDQHAVKMILESAQLLCTVLGKRGAATPYKPTHPQHPCVLWASRSRDNFQWLTELALALNAEYRYRFCKTQDHKSIAVVRALPASGLPARGLTPFVQVMPERYQVPGDPVQAYRNYYLGEKMRFARWTRRKRPRWAAARH